MSLESDEASLFAHPFLATVMLSPVRRVLLEHLYTDPTASQLGSSSQSFSGAQESQPSPQHRCEPQSLCRSSASPHIWLQTHKTPNIQELQ